MDAKIETLLEEAALKTPTDVYNQMVKDAENMDTKAWSLKYKDLYTSDPNLAVSWENEGMDKYSKSKWERMRDYFGSSDKENPFNKNQNQLNAVWQKEFSDIPKETFMSDIKKMSDSWESEKRAREYNAGRVRREREIKDASPFSKWALASDYSKQRYINEPEKSVFSDEGKWYNKGDDIRDVALGGLGLAGDFIPGVGAVVGPVARGVRDYSNYDTPYGHSVEEIGKERANDLAAFGGAAWLQNFRKMKRMAGGLGKELPLVGDVINSDAINFTTNATREGLAKIQAAKNIKEIDDILKNMPQNSFTADITSKLNDFKGWGDPEAVKALETEIKNMAKNNAGEFYTSFEKNAPKNIWELKKPLNESTPEVNKVLREEGANTKNILGTQSKHGDVAKDLALQPNVGKFGQVVRDVGLPAYRIGEQGVQKRITSQYEGTPKDKDRILKDWYIKNYARDWDMGFKPNEKSGDPLWEAYKEYKGL